jgi:hypothetical protein
MKNYTVRKLKEQKANFYICPWQKLMSAAAKERRFFKKSEKLLSSRK